jgi:proprotein convertase subtilisin/kexin type 5
LLCISACPSPITYTDTINNICQNCPTNCSYCSGFPITICTACNPGYYLDQNRCYLTCQTNGYVINGLVCTNCSAPCITCSGLVTNCTSCNVSSLNIYLFNNNCLSTCGSGYYNNVISDICSACTSPCETCTNVSVSSCLTCIQNYYLFNSTCSQTCPNSYYMSGLICVSCPSGCLTCSSATICNSCNSSLYYLSGSCLNSCPVGMLEVSNICTNCYGNCQTCLSASTQCTSCYNTYYLLGGVCYITCPTYYYSDSATDTCAACVSPCSDCSAQNVCKSCVSGYSLDSGSCLTTCTNNKISISQVCYNCNI